MPAYEWKCKDCGEVFEEIQSVADRDKNKGCPYCMGSNVTRQCGNAGGFRLKGDGWGEDNYDKYIGDINKTRKRDGKHELSYDDIHGTNVAGNK